MRSSSRFAGANGRRARVPPSTVTLPSRHEAPVDNSGSCSQGVLAQSPLFDLTSMVAPVEARVVWAALDRHEQTDNHVLDARQAAAAR